MRPLTFLQLSSSPKLQLKLKYMKRLARFENPEKMRTLKKPRYETKGFEKTTKAKESIHIHSLVGPCCHPSQAAELNSTQRCAAQRATEPSTFINAHSFVGSCVYHTLKNAKKKKKGKDGKHSIAQDGYRHWCDGNAKGRAPRRRVVCVSGDV
jgi:hypothetical protein